MKDLPTYTVQIWLGLREGYDGPVHSIAELESICQNFVDFEKTCLTVTPTNFIYVHGYEPGAVIGFIQYPRFPKDESMILNQARTLAYQLMGVFKQQRCTLITPKVTITLGEE